MSVGYFTSAIKIFEVLDQLSNNFVMGLSSKDIEVACCMNAITATRCVNTLVEAGYAEPIAGTHRFRPSVRFAQKATRIATSLNTAMKSVEELQQRINTES